MNVMANERFDEAEIIEKILIAVDKKENIIKKTIEILKGFPHYTWIGIYLVEGEHLVLKHYIGRPTEHTRIEIGSGICGSAVAEKRTIVVPDVSADERYIACSAETKSEIVVPIWRENRIIGEIDIDSDFPDAFGSDDKMMLESIAEVLGDVLG